MASEHLLLYIDTGTCTVFLPGVECWRRKMLPIFSLVSLVGIQEHNFNILYVAFSFSIDWAVVDVHARSLMFWSRVKVRVEPDNIWS